MYVLKNKNLILFITSVTLSYLLYLFSIQVSKIYSEFVVPTGDPFSYEASLINLYNYSSVSFFNYIKGIIQTLTSADWYYAYKLPVALFSPFISGGNHEDLLIVNYFYLLILIFIIQYCLKYINKNNFINLLSLIFVFSFPFLWGYRSNISINQLSLDTQVLLISISYFFLLISFYHRYLSTNLAIITSILGGFLFLTRGNAMFYFIILSLPTVCLFFLRLFKFNKKKRNIFFKKILVPVILFLLIVGWFYFFTFTNIYNYYSIQTVAYDYSKIPLSDIIKSIKIIFLNYPGAFFTNTSFHALTLNNSIYTLIFYLMTFFVFFLFRYKSKSNIKYLKHFSLIKLCLVTIVFSKIFEIYGIPFFANGIEVRQIMYIPLIPFFIIIIIFNIYIWNFIIKKINKIFFNILSLFYLVFILFFVLIVSFMHTNFNVPKKSNDDGSFTYMKRVVNPYELEKFSLEFDNNSKLYVLYYNIYNPSIINYYRIKNDYPGIIFDPILLSNIIAPTVNNYDFRGGFKNFKTSLIKIFNDADYIILPKYLDDYKIMWWSVSSKHYDAFYDVLSKENIPKFRVIKELNDTIDLVLLAKTNDSNYDIYDGRKKVYRNVDLDIDLYRFQTKNLWFSLTFLNNFSDFFDSDFLKRLKYGNKYKIGSILDPNRMLDNNNDTFFEKPAEDISLLVTTNSNKPLKSVSVLVENRSNKISDNFHHNSNKIKPADLSILGSNDLENWSFINEYKSLVYDDNGISRNELIENESFNYYLIQLMSINPKSIRVYDIHINDNLDKNWKVKYLDE